VSNLSQCHLFTFRKQQSTLDLTSQDMVLCRQILIPKQEFLVDGSGYVGHAGPKHLGFLLNLQPRESEIVDAVSQSEKSIRGEPVETCKLRYFKSLEIFDHAGFAAWDQNEIAARLELLGLPQDSGLSVMAVELLPEASMVFGDPLGGDLGEVRILRTSPLTPVPTVCVDA
jgi:hypothetical protein